MNIRTIVPLTLLIKLENPSDDPREFAHAATDDDEPFGPENFLCKSFHASICTLSVFTLSPQSVYRICYEPVNDRQIRREVRHLVEILRKVGEADQQ